MKTEHFLHGGSAQHENPQNDLFFKEILKNAPAQTQILLVHFAGSPERLEANIEKDTNQFKRSRGNKKLTFIQAQEDKFMEQIKQADVIYLGGGTTARLMSVLEKYPDLQDAFRGKIIAGESAGANVQSTYCYSKSGGGITKGLGILPVFVYPHYEDGGEAEIDLTQVPDHLEKLYLPNYQFNVIEV